MQTQPTRPAASRQHPLLIAAALAVILFCAVGTAAIMGWLPSSKGSNRNQLSDADRAALAASLQQPAQPAGLAAPLPSSAAAPVPLQAAPAAPAQSLAAAPAYPAAAPQYAPQYATGSAPATGTTAYGSSSQGSTASGYAPAPAPAPLPAEPVREKAVATRTAEADSGSRWCATCGNVESIHTITTRARGSGVGAAGGAILGGLLGNQIGGGSGRQLATVAGAVGGAVVGNQVEGNMKASHSYEIRVRLDDGTLRTFHQRSVPQWRNGDRVRIVKGSLRRA